MRKDIKAFPQKKVCYIKRLHSLLNRYNKIVFVQMQYVSSNHIKDIKIKTRGKAEMIMGKNTLIKKAIEMYPRKTEKGLDVCLPHLVNCIAMVMTNGDIKEIKAIIEEFSCAPPVKAGIIAIADVEIQPHITNLSPDKTEFFQNLNIATRIEKTSIQIINPVKLVKKGERVNSSQASLLDLLKLRPFVYKATCSHVWESGSMYNISLLDQNLEELVELTKKGLETVLNIGFSIGVTSPMMAGHSIRNGIHKVLLASMGAEIDNELTKSIKAAADAAAKIIVEGGSLTASASAVAPASSDSSKKSEPVVAEKAAPQEEKDDSEDLADAFDFF